MEAFVAKPICELVRFDTKHGLGFVHGATTKCKFSKITCKNACVFTSFSHFACHRLKSKAEADGFRAD